MQMVQNNDGDGAVDCDDDPDCAQNSCCTVGNFIECDCTDEIDNDGNGQTDCADTFVYIFEILHAKAVVQLKRIVRMLWMMMVMVLLTVTIVIVLPMPTV